MADKLKTFLLQSGINPTVPSQGPVFLQGFDELREESLRASAAINATVKPHEQKDDIRVNGEVINGLDENGLPSKNFGAKIAGHDPQDEPISEKRSHQFLKEIQPRANTEN